ncbi:MAG: histidine--tRNA ligase [Candidatus Omnitrophica bacterium]|nr:histidine--tRNA ligase [Candidatus Omnitrophota bacterium]
MKKVIKGLRGMPDILPGDAGRWQYIENTARTLFAQYGYEEIKTPVLEETALFQRSIGKETDIVQKQMYNFKDRGNRDIALRPEGTAPIVRSYLEHNLDKQMPYCRLYYVGPMFRSERPQAGRNRQFYQIGVEAIGSASQYADAEVICLMMKLLEASGLHDTELKINCLGCDKDKEAFEQVLRKALEKQVKCLCEDCVQRHKKNVLRIFDCKNDSCKLILGSAPKIVDHICPDCQAHFNKVKEALESIKIKYSVNPLLVRGLDYYTGTVFEVTHKNLGSQDAVAAGGRYDGLIDDMGGDRTPACGFAIGVDRLLLAARDKIPSCNNDVDLFLVLLGEEAQKKGFKILADLRENGVACQMTHEARSLKSQMRLADRLKAKKVLIIGEDELKNDKAILRDMENKQQKEIKINDVTNTHLW